MSYTIGVSCLLLLSGIVVSGHNLCSAEEPGDVPEVVNPRYLELVSLRESSDATHKTAIMGPDGRTWYREAQPVVDLSKIMPARTFASETVNDKILVHVFVRKECTAALYEWCSERIEKSIGVVVDGKLLVVETLHTTLSNYFAIDVDTPERALRIWAMIRVGGDPAKAEAEMARITKELQEAPAVKPGRHPTQTEQPDFEIVGLSRTPTSRHTMPIDGLDGEWWYREPAAGLNNSHCNPTSDRLGGMPNGAYGFQVVVKDSHVKEFAEWCRRRIGERFGLVFRGSLMFADRIPGAFVDSLNRITLVIEPAERAPSAQADPAPTDTGGGPRIEIGMWQELVRVVEVYPEYLEVVSLRAKSDETHQIPVEGPNGQIWHRERTPGLNLTRCNTANTEVGGFTDSRHVLYVWVHEGQRERFADWCRQRQGGHVGVMLNGRLVRVRQLGSEPTGLIAVAEYDSREEAIEQRDIIRQGGRPLREETSGIPR